MQRVFITIFSLLLVLPTTTIWAQNASVTTMSKRPQKKKRTAPITEEMSFGLRLNSDGWSALVERGFINNYAKRTGFIWMDLSEKKHSKEHKQLNETYAAIFPEQPAPLSYKYGKINNFYQLKMGYGQRRELTGKLDKKNVVVHWTYAVGASIGFLKPYYLELLIPEGNNTFTRQTISYNDAEKQQYFLDEFSIIGGTIFTKGIAEIDVKPGATARTGFYFDYSPNEKSYLGIEIGSSLEIYPQTIPIMANTKNSAAFLNLYVDVRFGQRWSRQFNP